MATMTGAELLQHLTSGKFTRVEFVKRDGTIRLMTCRYGVRKHSLGVGMSYEPKDHNLLVVWDTVKQEYRMVPLLRVLRVKVKGTWIEVSHDNTASATIRSEGTAGSSGSSLSALQQQPPGVG